MSRSSDEIRTSMAASIRSVSPQIDTVKGPIPYTVLKPVGDELAVVETSQERLSRLYSILWASTMTDVEIDAFGATYGLLRGTGAPALGKVTFYTANRPAAGTIISIPAGTLVTTRDGTVAFQTIQNVSIVGDSADLYYNSTTRWYEVMATVASLSVGGNTEVAEYNVNTIPSGISGIMGVENRARIEGGTDKQSKVAYGKAISNRFLGMATGTGGGIEQLFAQSVFKDELKSINLVWSSDYQLFKRAATGPALDAYFDGVNNELTYFYNYTTLGGETELTFPLSPILSVTRVVVDGIVWTEGASIQGWLFQPDESAEYKLSSRAQDKLILVSGGAPIPAGISIGIDLIYDRQIWELQLLYDMEYNALFATDCMTRRLIDHPVVVQVKLFPLAGADIQAIQQNAFDVVSDFCNSGYVSRLDPNALREELMQNPDVHGANGGISHVQIQKFTSLYGSTRDVEVIYLNKNERPFADDTLISVKVAQ